MEWRVHGTVFSKICNPSAGLSMYMCRFGQQMVFMFVSIEHRACEG